MFSLEAFGGGWVGSRMSEKTSSPWILEDVFRKNHSFGRGFYGGGGWVVDAREKHLPYFRLKMFSDIQNMKNISSICSSEYVFHLGKWIVSSHKRGKRVGSCFARTITTRN